VAQAVGDYLTRLERYEEAREEYQQATAAYEQVLPSSPNYSEAQTNKEKVLKQLQELPDRQKSSEAYRLDWLLANAPTPSRPMAAISSVNLSQWMRNVLAEGWQGIEEFWRRGEAELAYGYGLRSRDVECGGSQTSGKSASQTPGETLGEIIAQLGVKGLEIPPIARAAYRDLPLADNCLQLYGLTWTTSEGDDLAEWVLMLILGAQFGNPLPPGLKLQVSDLTTILVEQEVEPNSEQTYLYARLVGTGDEQFLVTVASSNEQILTLSIFSFIPE
jgi:hypothetical protein